MYQKCICDITLISININYYQVNKGFMLPIVYAANNQASQVPEPERDWTVKHLQKERFTFPPF